MRILLIAYSFPPLIDAQSFRWYYLSNALAELGIQIDVLTMRYPFGDGASWDFHKNIEVFETFPVPLSFLH